MNANDNVYTRTVTIFSCSLFKGEDCGRALLRSSFLKYELDPAKGHRRSVVVSMSAGQL